MASTIIQIANILLHYHRFVYIGGAFKLGSTVIFCLGLVLDGS